MSSRGEIMPELAAVIESIAGRIEAGAATADDALTLRRLATRAAGEGKDWELRVHKRGQGRPKAGAIGVRDRFDLARKVGAHRAAFGLSLEDTYLEVTKLPGTPGTESIKKAWQEMKSLLDMDEAKRELILKFKELEARGLNVSVKRVKRDNR